MRYVALTRFKYCSDQRIPHWSVREILFAAGWRDEMGESNTSDISLSALHCWILIESLDQLDQP